MLEFDNVSPGANILWRFKTNSALVKTDAYRIMKTRIEDYSELRQVFIANKKQGFRSAFGLLLISLSPLLLVLAIALKITKVTSEYLLTR